MLADKAKKRRLENTTVACPIVFGSIAFWMGKKAAEHATHRWTLFVRGPNDEDLSCFVSKIIFSLHPSFAVPLREIVSPPFEVTELGWGEFEAGIRIFFKDPDEKPVDILHMIRLYPEGGPQTVSKKPVVMEFYDEVVFTSPTPQFRAQLMQYVPPVPRPITWLTEYYTVFSEETDLQKLMVVQDHLAQQLDVAKAKLLRQEAELGHLKAVCPTPLSSALPSSYQQMQMQHQQAMSSQQPSAAGSSSTASSASSSAGGNKKKGGSEGGTKAERDKAERDRVAAATKKKKAAAAAKAKKEKAEKEKSLKDKAKTTVTTTTITALAPSASSST